MISQLLTLVVFLTPAFAYGARTVTIQSPQDTFTLTIVNKKSGSVQGKPSDLKALADLWPVLDSPLTNDCPPLKDKPDVTVKENDKVRSIYFKAGMVSDGKQCLSVGGEGLYYFPTHRDFLIGPKRDSVKLKSPLKLFRQGVKIVELRKDGDHWVSENKDVKLNWDFFERFENALNDFDVRLRVNAGIAQGKPKMIMQSGSDSYELYKVTGVMWAIKKPGQSWLTASDDWSFWYDFDQSVIEDRHAAEIKKMEQVDAKLEERKAAMEKLEGAWSPNLREAYHRILLNPQEDLDLQVTAINRLKRKPSLETSGVMVKVLSEHKDEDIKRIAGQILKAYNPKGPLYKNTLPAAEKAKVIEFWNNWWNQNRKGP